MMNVKTGKDVRQPTRRAGQAPVVLDVAELLCGRREVRLRHGDHEYRLRLTKADKLILTK